MQVAASDVFVSMPRDVDEGPGFQEVANNEYGRAEEVRLPEVRWHQSCKGVIALRLWTATPYPVEIAGRLNFGE